MDKNQINIVIDGKHLKGNPGDTILDVAKENGIHIPTLCHDDRIKPYSSCYVCVVEIEGTRGNQPSCSTKINEGMIITTNSEKIKTARKTALDLILSNHYADCVAPCKQTCPAGVDVQGYISLIDKGMYSEAVALIKQDNPLPAICGRVCVRPCEAACRRNLLEEGTGVGIDYMKRFASDEDLMSDDKYAPEVAPSTDKKVAVIGAGPGGLSSAYWLQAQGHQVDIYEAMPYAGGWLRYGIPEYRLPNDILQKEVDNVTELGTNIFYNQKLGDNLSYKDIQSKYDATVLTIGSQKGTLIGCEGDDAENVYSGIDFLRNMEATGQKADFTGKTVVVVGGGNTAMDCCRTAMRCNAEKVYVVYRRTEKEMPANPIEIHESKLEGVEYLFLTNPKRVNKDENGVLKSVTLLKMELGEPDKSGRRRPVPVEGSDFDLEVDYILAAIGQKTIVNFLEDVNEHTTEGKLAVNRWGDIDVNSKTLQTGIPSMFAAGDGVSGPATIIEAIAQAKIACHSVNQYLNGEEIKPAPDEFISKKDNFKKQETDEYKGKFLNQLREEMPVLEADDRKNFKEVELGYSDEEVARNEAQRCLECGCTEYYTCDLKRYATEYGVEQNKFEGEFREYQVDFRDAFVEIDNNKCILCSRCVRMCREVVGANALGLVERGFKTFVAPSMGDSLQEAGCVSCGMCIETCPTGAITENVIFKPGPVELEKIETIDPFGAEGFEINIEHHKGFVHKASSRKGDINAFDFINRNAKFGYKHFNDGNRITKPLIKFAGEFKEISFDEAYEVIADHIRFVEPDELGFFAGARLSNEEMFLIQKLARLAGKTNNVDSFHYMGRGTGYLKTSILNADFTEIEDMDHIFLVGAELPKDHPVISHIVNKVRTYNQIPITTVSKYEDSELMASADKAMKAESYYYFVKALIHYILAHDMHNGLFLNDHIDNFEEYKKEVLSDDFDDLYDKIGSCCMDHFVNFAKEYTQAMNSVIIFSEKEVSANTVIELHNLAIITGKLGKTANGLIGLKEKYNAHGLMDMGMKPELITGGQSLRDENVVERVKETWKVESLPSSYNSVSQLFSTGKLKNLFIYGEDPVGCAKDKEQMLDMLDKSEFIMVQDHFITETAEIADLIMPASFIEEIGGTVTNTQKKIQMIEPQMEEVVDKSSVGQLVDLLYKFGINGITEPTDVLKEAVSMLPEEEGKLKLELTQTDESEILFDYGCDNLTKRIEEEFEI
jgi:formate dehydrogenase major subunit